MPRSRSPVGAGVELRELLEVLRENTKAITENSNATEKLADKITESVQQTAKVHDMLLTRSPKIEAVFAAVEHLPELARNNVIANKGNVDAAVREGGNRITWTLAICTFLIALSSLFEGAGTRWLTAIHMLK